MPDAGGEGYKVKGERHSAHGNRNSTDENRLLDGDGKRCKVEET
jgi:hypothetical protein